MSKSTLDTLKSLAKTHADTANPERLVRGFGDVNELRNKYGYNLPPVSTLRRLYDRERSRQMVSSIIHQSGTPPVLRLLFTGRLPETYFNDLCYGNKTKLSVKKSFHYEPKRERTKNLWEPRKGLVKTELDIERAVYEARCRHRRRLNDISVKAHSHCQVVEGAMMRHLLVESRGLRFYLNKLEKEVQQLKEKWEKKHGEKKARKSLAVGATVTQTSTLPKTTSQTGGKCVTIKEEPKLCGQDEITPLVAEKSQFVLKPTKPGKEEDEPAAALISETIQDDSTLTNGDESSLPKEDKTEEVEKVEKTSPISGTVESQNTATPTAFDIGEFMESPERQLSPLKEESTCSSSVVSTTPGDLK